MKKLLDSTIFQSQLFFLVEKRLSINAETQRGRWPRYPPQKSECSPNEDRHSEDTYYNQLSLGMSNLSHDLGT